MPIENKKTEGTETPLKPNSEVAKYCLLYNVKLGKNLENYAQI